MSLLTAVIVKSSQILAGIYLKFFLKNKFYTKIERLSIPNLDISEKKIGKVVIKQDKFLHFFAN